MNKHPHDRDKVHRQRLARKLETIIGKLNALATVESEYLQTEEHNEIDQVVMMLTDILNMLR